MPTFGDARMKRECDLIVSNIAIQRIWRQHALPKKRPLLLRPFLLGFRCLGN
jgi:hypothetical protein